MQTVPAKIPFPKAVSEFHYRGSPTSCYLPQLWFICWEREFLLPPIKHRALPPPKTLPICFCVPLLGLSSLLFLISNQVLLLREGQFCPSYQKQRMLPPKYSPNFFSTFHCQGWPHYCLSLHIRFVCRKRDILAFPIKHRQCSLQRFPPLCFHVLPLGLTSLYYLTHLRFVCKRGNFWSLL